MYPECHGCHEEIDSAEGVTVDTERHFWHPDCRRVELRKITGQAKRTPGRPKRETVPPSTDEDDEV